MSLFLSCIRAWQPLGVLTLSCLFLSPASHAQSSPDEQITHYTVTATRPYYDETLSRIFPQYQFDQQNLVTPLHTNDVLLQSPSVSLNGQGGQIQSISIRGYSRWRIQTLVEGVPIVSDRRAGSSVGFMPPDFISSVAVLPGAASTYFGSGALGGAVNLRLAESPQPHIRVGYSSNQPIHTLSYVDGTLNTDWGIAYRSADSGEDASGNTLFDQFDQTALFVRHRFDSSALKEAWTLYSDNNDIGKSSSDYPDDKITLYPDNRHWLGKLGFATNHYSGDIWWHQSSLSTSVLRPFDRVTSSQNKALDYGFDIKSDSAWQAWLFNWQLQVAGREGVVAHEQEFQLPAGELTYELNTLNASEINAAGIMDVSHQWGRTALALGARIDWQRQSDDSDMADQTIATNVSGYIGANYQLSPRWATSLYVSSAFRNPSLTERFFSGETPRGTVLGDPELDTEQALNTQVTVAHTARQLQGSVELFYQQVDHYIERMMLSAEVLQYANLAQATITGASYQLNWQSQDNTVDAGLSGTWIQGEDNAGNPLADIPAQTQRLNVGMQQQDMRFFTVLAYRAAKSAFAAGEQALDDVVTLDIGARWQVNARTQLQASWTNLTNQHYPTSADDKAAFAQGKSLQLALTYLL